MVATREEPSDDRLNLAVRHICRNSAAMVGSGFFPAMARDLWQILRCDYAFIGELTKAGDAIETLAVCADGEAAEGLRYELLDTPCANVVGTKTCVYADDVASLFPKDLLLAKMNARGYVGVPIYDGDGRPSGIIVAIYRGRVDDADFSGSAISVFAGRIGAEVDRLRAAHRADQMELRVLQAQKLESLGVLAGGLAHDFNNFLASMLGSADLARLELASDHPAREHLETIREAGSTAAALCRQLLAYAGKGRFQVEHAHISEIVNSQARILRASTGENVTLHFSLTDEEGAVAELDRGQMSQILLNLVINASEAIGEGSEPGLIRVTTGVTECDAGYLRTTYLDTQAPAGTYLFLEVSDDGPGMTEEVRDRLFDPFFTTKFTGRGLGLAAILGIVKSHSGTIKVYSEATKGTTFRILFPVSSSAPERATAGESIDEWRGSGKVLLVDDNDLIRRVGARMLDALGFEPVVAEDGVAALEVLDRQGDDSALVILVILDLTMPRMNGEETYRAMRARYPKLPVILTSGFNEQDTVQHFAGKGLAGFLQKPFQLEDLRKRTREALAAPASA